jgi:hypothetical protein
MIATPSNGHRRRQARRLLDRQRKAAHAQGSGLFNLAAKRRDYVTASPCVNLPND